MRRVFLVLLFAPLLAARAQPQSVSGGQQEAPAPQSDCRGESYALVPLEPVALSPAEARESEEALRAALGRLSGVCLLPREHSAERLRAFEGHRVPPCPDAACRTRIVQAFGAQWLLGGSAYGLGGGRTVNVFLWSADGRVVQRTSYAGGAPLEPVARIIREARVGRSLVASGEEGAAPTPRPSRVAQWVMGGAAVVAFAAGGGFGTASAQTSQRISAGATGCPGTGEDYRRCFATTVRRGENQALAANLLYATGAVLGAGAVVTFALEWP